MEKKANNVLWVERWINEVRKSDDEIVTSFGEQYDCNRWICEFYLPLINKKVKAISKKEVNAVLRANGKAAILINKYMKEHRELNIKNNFMRKRYVISYDQDGRIKSIGLSKASRRKIGARYEETVVKTLEIVEKAIQRIKKINGISKGLVIQVYDKSHFSQELSEKELIHQMASKLREVLGKSYQGVTVNLRNEHVIAIGYSNKKMEE